MEIYKRPDSKFWIADFFVGTRRIRKSTKQTKRSAATEVAAEMLRIATAKLEAPAPAKPKPMPTIAQFAESEFLPFVKASSLAEKSKLYYQNGWRMLGEKDYCQTPLDQVYKSDVDQLRFGGSPTNENNPRRMLSRLLSLAVEKGVIRARPRLKLLKERKREGVFSAELEGRSVDLALQPLKDVFLIEIDAGMRPAEVIRMRWEEVLWDKGLIFVPFGKTPAARRHVPISDRVRQALRARAEGATSPWVFPSKRSRTGHIGYWGIADQFRQLRALASVPDDLVLYSARHTFATDLLDQTGNIKLVQEALGHESLETTQRYLHPSKRGLADAINQRNEKRAEELAITKSRHVLRHGADVVQ